MLVNQETDIPWADKVYAIPFQKSLLSVINIKAIFQSKALLERERYNLISTNTTLTGLIVRAAVRLMGKRRPMVCHIAHGYLFNLSDGLKKWLYLLPEIIVAPITDRLLVMNQEDWKIAEKYHLYQEKLCYTDGMGVHSEKGKLISLEEKKMLRKQAGYSDSQFLFVYLAEFSKRKNQAGLIQAFAYMGKKDACLLLGGEGQTKASCQQLARDLGVEEQIRFLGYVTDVTELYQICDCVVSSSRIEGLPFHMIEAEGCGLPVVATDIKGHRELVKEGYNGYLCKDLKELSCNMRIISELPEQKRQEMGIRSRKRFEKCTLDEVKADILKFYGFSTL